MWEQGMMTMDYEALTSPVGKLKAEKARNTIESPNRGVVSYLPAVTRILESSIRNFMEADYHVQSFREFMELPTPSGEAVKDAENLKAPYTFENLSFSYMQAGLE